MPAHLIPRLVLFLAIAMAVVAALVIYADGGELLDALERFEWWLVPLILLLVAGNYLLRFLRWQYYLRLIKADGDLSTGLSALVFLSGLAMVITPAKAGEWIKSYFLREINQTPIGRSAPVVFVERVTDAWSVFLLALSGLFLFSIDYWPLFLVFAVLQVALWLVIRHRNIAHWILDAIARLPLLSGASQHFENLYDASYQLLSPRALVAGLAFGFVGWGCEALGLYLVVYGLTDSGSLETLVKSAFIMSTSSLAGALFIVPGGLGVSETSITGLGRGLLDMSRSTAAAATVLIRFFTLWFGVAVGLTALILISRRLGRPIPLDSEVPQAEAV